jgi:hypothetical protein
MPYQINRFNGVPLVTVDDGTLDQTTDLKLVGKNYAGYGEAQNENYLWLLESFSNTTPPTKPVSGQVWFDSSVRKLKFYDNTKWRTTGGAEVSTSAPTGLTIGDFWYDSAANQLYAYTGSEYVLVGPQSVTGAGQTSLESVSVKDNLGNSHAIVKAVVDGKTVFTISADTNFTLDNNINPITGFSVIAKGITLIDSSTGSTTSAYRLFGTASDTDKLGGHPASTYITNSNPVFTNTASFPDDGITVGNDHDILIYVDGGTIGTIKNTVSPILTFKVTDGVTIKEPLKLSGSDVIPGANLTYNLGNTSYRWLTVWGGTGNFENITVTGNVTGNVSGTSSRADTLLFNADYRSATNNNVGNSIVARDAAGNFSANVVTGTATQARYADLAERYEADNEYEPGTVVVFGGDREITTTDQEYDSRIAGVVSTNPAFLMNEAAGNDVTHPPIALRGKVPVKVIGKVNKGDVLISSSIPGYAMSAFDSNSVAAAAMIGKALENKEDDGQGTVTVVVS